MMQKIIVFFVIAILLLMANVYMWAGFGANNVFPHFMNNQYVLWAWVLLDVFVFVILLAYLVR